MMYIKRKGEQFVSLQPSLESMKIIKRDGRLVDFDDQKIYDYCHRNKYFIKFALKITVNSEKPKKNVEAEKQKSRQKNKKSIFVCS